MRPAIHAGLNAAALLRSEADVVHLLLVDDNPSFLDAATVLLEREGLSVVAVASTADEAIRRVGELDPDVVLVDITLGSENGFDLAQQLSESGSTVILISTHSGADFADLIAESPAVGFVPKAELSAAAIRRLASEPRER